MKRSIPEPGPASDALIRAEVRKLLDETVELYHAAAAEREAMSEMPEHSPEHVTLFDVEVFSDTIAGLADSLARRGYSPRLKEAMSKIDWQEVYGYLQASAGFPQFRQYILAVDHLGRLVRDYVSGRRDAA